MQTGTVSTNASAPTYMTLTLMGSRIAIQNALGSVGALCFASAPTATFQLDTTLHSTIEPGNVIPHVMGKNADGVNRLALCSVGGAASGDVAQLPGGRYDLTP